MKARFLEAAQKDVREAVRYYEAQRPGLGREFRDEIRTLVARIKTLPDAWSPLSENTRRCRSRRFPYGVIYQARGDELIIVAVAQLNRDPQHWRDRL